MAGSQAIEWAKVAVIPLVVALGGVFLTSWQKDRDNADNASPARRRQPAAGPSDGPRRSDRRAA